MPLAALLALLAWLAAPAFDQDPAAVEQALTAPATRQVEARIPADEARAPTPERAQWHETRAD